MTEPIIFLNGEFIEADEAQLQSLSPGFLPGSGVFETMRVYPKGIPFFTEHLERLVRGLKTLKIPVPSRFFLKQRIKETLGQNHLEEAKVRLTIWKDQDHRQISIVGQPYKPFSEEAYRQGFKAMTVTHAYQKSDPSGQCKSIAYAAFLKARLKAERKGFNEAILLDPTGQVIEGSRTNVFLIRDDQLLTPPAASGCLEGITRRQVISLAGRAGLRVTTPSLRFKDFATAQEAFLTNSLIEIMPLTSIAKKPIGSGSSGPKTHKLRNFYQELVQHSLS